MARLGGGGRGMVQQTSLCVDRKLYVFHNKLMLSLFLMSIISFHFVFKYCCEFVYIKLAISTIIWLKLKPLLQKSNQLRLNLLFIIIISHIILYNLETAKAGVRPSSRTNSNFVSCLDEIQILF